MPSQTPQQVSYRSHYARKIRLTLELVLDDWHQKVKVILDIELIEKLGMEKLLIRLLKI